MAIELYGVSSKTPIKSSTNTAVNNGMDSIQGNKTSSINTKDTVSLTQIAQQLKEAETVLASVPIVNVPRVEEIAHSLKEGDYSIDAEHTAEKIIEFEEQLAS